MSKLLKLKKWVTLEDAAKRFSAVFEEEVSVADVLRLGADGELTLSVNIVNGATGKRALKVSLKQDETVFGARSSLFVATDDKSIPGEFRAIGELRHLKKEAERLGFEVNFDTEEVIRKLLRDPLTPVNTGDDSILAVAVMGTHLDDDHILQCTESLEELWGVYDLTMVGSECLDVEHQYQALTGGPEVTASKLGGVLLKSSEGDYFQLQEYCREEIDEPGAADNYYPAGELPHDAPLVVRTSALQEFESRVGGLDALSDNPHRTDALVALNLASKIFWGQRAQRDVPSTYPKNAEVVDWLRGRGLSARLANAGASIIRRWTRPGRPPGSN